MKTSRRDWVKLTGASLAAFAYSSIAAASPRALRLLILGGTGFIGPHQVRYALSRGHTVTLFNRGRHKQEWPGSVEELIGDRNTGDLKSLQDRSWDVCIDNPTTLPFWVRDVGAALREHVKQYLFISTISAYADNLKPNADESAPLAPYTGPDALAETMETLRSHVGQLYGPLKAASENEALKQFPKMTTIVRPGLIVGPGDETDRFTYWPVRLARGGEVLAPGDGSDAVQVIDARDLAQWTIRLAETHTLGAFNATGPAHPLSMAQMLATIAQAVQVKPTLTWVPAKFLEEQKIEPWTDMPVWVPDQGPDAGFAKINSSKAIKAGLTLTALSKTSADTLEWFHQQPMSGRQNLKRA